jgi:uncharacterized protein YjbJ (UPF0337 family)
MTHVSVAEAGSRTPASGSSQHSGFHLMPKPDRRWRQLEELSGFSNDLEDQTMNKDIFEGKWKQIRGEAKSWWGKLTDDDLDRAAGKLEVLTGLLQEKYGYTREAAADEIDRRITEFEANLKKENKQ